MSSFEPGSDRLLKLWRSLYARADLGSGRALLLALICVAGAAVMRLLLALIAPTLIFATYFPAVLIASLIGGWRAGLFAIPLSVAAAWLLFDPKMTAVILAGVSLSSAVVFALSGLLVVAVAQFHRLTVFSYEELERERTTLAREVMHRSKNQAAIISALVRKGVSDKTEAETLVGRIRAIAEADDLLNPAGPPPLDLRALLTKVVQRSHGDQVRLNGPQLALTVAEARSLSLAFHEMMTNAAKYGPLRGRDGYIEITWQREAGALRIVWQEHCATPPPNATGVGFGLQLISTALAQINGKVTIAPEPSGYRYEIAA